MIIDRKSVNLVAFLTPMLLVLCLLFIRWQYGFLLFHTLAELFSVMVGVLMLVIVWNTRHFTRNNFLLYLGIGYFWIAVLDTWHTFTVQGMPFFDITDAEITLHFWVNTRFLESMLVLSAPLFLKRRLNARLMFSAGAGLALTVTWVSFAVKEPVMLSSDGLTAFKVNTEYLIMLLLGISIFVYILQREWLAPKVLYFLVTSIFLSILAELSFTLYTSFQGVPFVIGHLFKFLSFWMIYQAIVQTTLNEPFSVLAQASSSYDAIPHPAVVVDNQGMISQVNRAAEISSGKTAQQLMHKAVHHFFHPLHVSPEDCELCQAIKQCKTIKGQVVSFPEEHRWFLASLAPVKVVDKNSGMVHLFTDITERRSVEEALQQANLVVENSPVVLFRWIAAEGWPVEMVSENVTQFGYMPEDFYSGKTPFSSIVHPEDRERVTREVQEYSISGVSKFQQEYRIVTSEGDVRWIDDRTKVERDIDGNVTHYQGIVIDINDRKLAEERILHQAHFDSLTDLPNRFLALDRLSQLIIEAERNKERIAVLFLDLDDFKKINDTLGHETGDKLLIEAAERLRNVVRSVDTVGRLGGDEFIVLLGGIADITDASLVAENLLNSFRNAFRIGDRELLLTASIGITVYPDDGDSSSVLLRNADSAMYHSKDLGRNTYSYFTDTMNQGVSRRLALEEQIHGAMDRGEFRLCYQPQVAIGSNRVIGVEALLRWHNPALGEIPPVEFIPIAEQTGLIVSIGQFVLREALEVSNEWRQKYAQRLTVAVNLSPRQFRDPNLVAFIEDAIRQSGSSGESLELEITEGVLMDSHSYTDDVLAALSSLGVGISMDDFGTGYSSLSYLRSYPFDALKIDRSFINDITEDKADRELVNAIIAMAHGLGLKVVAEGVETKQQLELLAEQGCDFAQGYLFSRPVSAEEILKMLECQS